MPATMDRDEGLGQGFRNREIRSIDRKKVQPGMDAEVGLILLLLVSGLSGLAYSSVTVTATMFVGGVLTWCYLTLPEMMRQRNEGIAAEKAAAAEAAAKAAAQEGKPAAPAVPLPSPEATLTLIRKRRSMYPKDYSGERVPREQLERLLEAANWAPTHGLTEPWRFVVLEGASKAAMEELTLELCRTRLPADKAAKTLEKLEKKRDTTWGKVSCFISIGCKRQANPEKLMPEWEEMAAVACAVQNMALMATSMGLAAYWTSWQEVAREADEMKALLGLLPEDRLMGFFTVGRIAPERGEGYRGRRGAWADKVNWRD